MISTEQYIYLKSNRGANVATERISAKGKSSHRRKAAMQVKTTTCDERNSINVQRAIDKVTSISIARADIQTLKHASKTRRKMWAKNRKA